MFCLFFSACKLKKKTVLREFRAQKKKKITNKPRSYNELTPGCLKILLV